MTTNDQRTWWAVGADCIAEGGYVVEASSRRQALAVFRQKLVDAEVGGGCSRRGATEWVRHVGRWIEAGPMSTSEAYEYELSWTLALAVCRKMEGANRYEPLGPLRERPLAVRHLGEDHVSRIERQIFAAYSQTI